MVSVWEDAMDSHQLPVLPGMPGYDHGYLTSASRKSRDGDDLAALSGVYDDAARRHIESNSLSPWVFPGFHMAEVSSSNPDEPINVDTGEKFERICYSCGRMITFKLPSRCRAVRRKPSAVFCKGNTWVIISVTFTLLY